MNFTILANKKDLSAEYILNDNDIDNDFEIIGAEEKGEILAKENTLNITL